VDVGRGGYFASMFLLHINNPLMHFIKVFADVTDVDAEVFGDVPLATSVDEKRVPPDGARTQIILSQIITDVQYLVGC
jgi:hypothetical protein